MSEWKECNRRGRILSQVTCRCLSNRIYHPQSTVADINTCNICPYRNMEDDPSLPPVGEKKDKEGPGIIKMAGNLAKAVANHVKDGGKKESGAELTGDELIVTSDKQERIETAIKNKDVKTVSEEITKSMQEGNITPGAASHKTNPLPVAEDGIIYNDKGKPTGNTIKDGDAVYPNANVINKLTDKQIFNKTKNL